MATSHLTEVAPETYQLPERKTGPTDGPLEPDHLFAALDGREVNLSGDAYHLEVYGIFDQAETRWVQLAVKGRAEHAVTLKLAATDGVRAILAALSSWSMEPSDGLEIVAAR